MATNRTNTKIAKVITNEVKGENTMSNKNNTKRTANTNATMKGDIAMTIAKEIVKKNIANATMKGEATMNNNTTPMTAVITTNNALAGYEIRFSVAPSDKFREKLGIAPKEGDKRRKHYGFKFYSHLGNAWIIKQDKITEKNFAALKKEIRGLGYTITEDSVEPKAKAKKATKPAKKDTTLEVKTAKIPKEADLVEYLTSLGYVIELPKTEEKPKRGRKPNAKKAETKAEPKAKKETKSKKPANKKKATPKAETVTFSEAEMPF